MSGILIFNCSLQDYFCYTSFTLDKIKKTNNIQRRPDSEVYKINLLQELSIRGLYQSQISSYENKFLLSKD